MDFFSAQGLGTVGAIAGLTSACSSTLPTVCGADYIVSILATPGNLACQLGCVDDCVQARRVLHRASMLLLSCHGRIEFCRQAQPLQQAKLYLLLHLQPLDPMMQGAAVA